MARKRIRRKPGKLVVPAQSLQTPRPLAPSPSTQNIHLNVEETNESVVDEVTELKSQHHINDNDIQLKQIQLSPNRLTTNGSNNNPQPSDHKNSSNQALNIVKTPHKKTCKESLESKRERKAAKTLAIITGNQKDKDRFVKQHLYLFSQEFL